jgi:uncharacterized membrane protein YeaQ/YmgE (transglycosylase-associated protein family)
MPDGEWMRLIEQAIHDVLLWIGFGTVVGLTAKALMPGRDPGGAVATFLMGIAGSVLGCGTLLFFWHDSHVTPISALGFGAGTFGAFVLLLFYRIFSGSVFTEAEDGERWLHRKRRRRRADELASDI